MSQAGSWEVVGEGEVLPIKTFQLKFSKMSPLHLASLSLLPFLLENNPEFPSHPE